MIPESGKVSVWVAIDLQFITWLEHHSTIHSAFEVSPDACQSKFVEMEGCAHVLCTLTDGKVNGHVRAEVPIEVQEHTNDTCIVNHIAWWGYGRTVNVFHQGQG